MDKLKLKPKLSSSESSINRQFSKNKEFSSHKIVINDGFINSTVSHFPNLKKRRLLSAEPSRCINDTSLEIVPDLKILLLRDTSPFRVKAELNKVKTFEEKEFEKKLKTVSRLERILKQPIMKPELKYDCFLDHKIKKVKYTSYNLNSIFNEAIPQFNKIKNHYLASKINEIHETNQASISQISLKKLKYLYYKRSRPNLSSCFKITKQCSSEGPAS